MNDSKNKKTSNHINKKSKKNFKFKPIYIIPIVFVICCIMFGYYIFSSTRDNGPEYGQRCENVLEIDPKKLEEAKAAIEENDKIASLTLEKNCLAVKMIFRMVDGVPIDQAKQIAIDATHTLDDTLGYEKNNPQDPYSKIFGMDGDRRQYDIQISILSNGEGYPIFGDKQYQMNDIQFTDANAKNPELASELEADSQKTEEAQQE